jgi:hypothetical protein
MKFVIEVEMKDSWIPHFLSMLKYTEQLGRMGSSRKVSFYADGDGDFRPKFRWSSSLPSDAKPISDNDGNRLYDAGRFTARPSSTSYIWPAFEMNIFLGNLL